MMMIMMAQLFMAVMCYWSQHVLLCPGAETSGWRVSCFMPPNNFNNNCFNNLQHPVLLTLSNVMKNTSDMTIRQKISNIIDPATLLDEIQPEPHKKCMEQKNQLIDCQLMINLEKYGFCMFGTNDQLLLVLTPALTYLLHYQFPRQDSPGSNCNYQSQYPGDFSVI